MDNRSFLEKHRGELIWIAIILAVVVLFIWAGCQENWKSFESKKLWDWMELLIVPAALGFGVIGYNYLAQKAERIRALDKQRQETLNIYFDQMQELLLKYSLNVSDTKDKACSVARARTKTALQNLDRARIPQLLRLLSEAGIGGTKLFSDGLDLEKLNLREVDLSTMDLEGAYIRNSNLQKADLYNTTLIKAHLINTNLQGANLHGANMLGAEITPEQLEKAKTLEGATMPNGMKYEEWVAGGKPVWTIDDE